MSWPGPIRVVGVGSPLGDDALAWEVIRQLRQVIASRQDVELHEIEGGQRLFDVLDGRGTLLLVDALAGESPGVMHRFEWPDRRVESMRPGSTHHVRPAEALQLAATLGTLPPRVVVFGIEANCFDPRADLSPVVANAIPELVSRLLHDLETATTRNTEQEQVSAEE